MKFSEYVKHEAPNVSNMKRTQKKKIYIYFYVFGVFGSVKIVHITEYGNYNANIVRCATKDRSFDFLIN
jgi:hypothetical protein